jgi:hypothetical protein
VHFERYPQSEQQWKVILVALALIAGLIWLVPNVDFNAPTFSWETDALGRGSQTLTEWIEV